MNADDLRFFLAVRQAGSIKGGARILKVDHSTVSRRLLALEEALEASLFERTPEGLVDTELARAIAPLAERVELLTREIEDAAHAASDERSGPVRIAVNLVVAHHFLIPRLPELRAAFPNVTFDIVADIAPVNVLKREADIAIRQRPEGSPPAEPDALAMRVGKFGYALYGSRDYVERHGRPERPIRSLAGHEMISTGTFGPGDSWNAQLDEPASVAASIYPLTAVTTAVIAGVGVAVLGCLEADAEQCAGAGGEGGAGV
jgi:DNA-binding transcriptional LysR family regulator